MKILIINQHPLDVRGGSETQCDLLATHLTRLGHDVVYRAVSGAQVSYETPYTVEPGSLKLTELRQILNTYCPDVVYWRFNKRRFLPLAILCKFMKTKLVFAISHIDDVTKWAYRGTFSEFSTFAQRIREIYSFFRQRISSRINYLGFHLVDGVIAQLHQQTQKLPVRREIVVPNSVDAGTLPFQWERPYIVWVANIKARKNPELYIELAKHFQESPVDFLMVGEIQHSRYHALLQKSALPPNVRYIGPKSYHEVNGIIRQSLFLVLTCNPEGFPNVLLQAWMQGKPTISLYYDPDNMIRDNQIGYLSGDFEQFVDDTRALLENTTAREEMGRRAQKYATEHFSLESNIRKVEAFFHEICLK